MGAMGILHLRALVGFEIGLFVAGLFLLPRGSPAGGRLLETDSLSWSERTVVVGVIIAGTGLMIRSTATPITDYDSLAYHLPVMAKWYQTHAFVMLEQFFEGRFQISRYPYSWEALSTLFLLPLREDFLLAFPNLVAWAVFGLGISLVAIVLGAPRSGALAFAFLALTMPLVRAHVMTMHVDLALGAFFVAGVAFALRAPRDRFSTAVAVTCIGMVVGIKMSGLVYAGLIVAALSAAWLMQPAAPGPRVTGTRADLVGAAVALAGILSGGFWYARNLLQTGNPLGFAGVTVAGMTLFNGPLDADTIAATTLWRQFHFDNATHWHILLGQVRKELGSLFGASLLGAAAVAAFGPRTSHPLRREASLLAGLVAATALAYWTTPVTANNWDGGPITPWMGQGLRYALPFIGLLAATGGVLLGTTGTANAMVGPAAVVAGLLACSTRPMWLATLLVLSGLAFHHVASLRFGNGGRLVVACVGVVAAAIFVASLHTKRDTARARLYRGVPAFIERKVGRDDTVGYVLSHQSYLFYGTHFDRRVEYVPAGADQRPEWIARLRAQHIGFLAVGPVRPEWRRRKELDWIQEEDGTFTRVFGRDEATEPVIYRVEASSPG